VLKVVKDKQRLPRLQMINQVRHLRDFTGSSDSKTLGYCRYDLCGAGERRQWNEADALGLINSARTGGLDCYAGLAHAAWSRQGYEALGWGLKEGID
jgi:hypothetical protein